MTVYKLKSLINQDKGSKWINCILYVLILILILLIIFFNLVSLCGVIGESMENSFFNSEQVLMKKDSGINFLDVVVFKGEKYTSHEYVIKRVIAKEGERIAFASDDLKKMYLYIYHQDSFKKIDEPYIKDGYMDYKKGRAINIYIGQLQETMQFDQEFIISIDKDNFFVLGDNRNNSTDSREFGQINKDDIIGRVFHKLKKDSLLEKLFLLIYKPKNINQQGEIKNDKNFMRFNSGFRLSV